MIKAIPESIATVRASHYYLRYASPLLVPWDLRVASLVAPCCMSSHSYTNLTYDNTQTNCSYINNSVVAGIGFKLTPELQNPANSNQNGR